MSMNNLFVETDGADPQAQAVLAYLRMHDGIECSWNDSKKKYDAEPNVNRFHNCREQGYSITLFNKDYSKNLVILFFEHRNSDNIVIIHWDQKQGWFNPVTINDIPEDHPWFNSKYDYDKGFNYGEAEKAASYIYDLMENWWKENNTLDGD